MDGRYIVNETCSGLNGKRLLDAWLEHLFCCAVGPTDCRTYCIGREKGEVVTRVMSPVADSVRLLEYMAGLFRLGSSIPLLFFPKSAHAFARKIHTKKVKPGQLDKARSEAWKTYYGTAFSRSEPEGNDPYLRLFFGGADPFAVSHWAGVAADYLGFEDLAEGVYGPMFDHLGESDEAL